MMIYPLLLAMAASTQPTSKPSVETELRRIISGLQKQIVELKKSAVDLKDQNNALSSENEKLKARLADIEQHAADAKPKSIQDALQKNEFAVGMSIEDAKKVASSRSATYQSIERETTTGHFVTWTFDHYQPGWAYQIEFKDGEITSIVKH